jgi:RimJ/RimL family protein N-acetyltransferase
MQLKWVKDVDKCTFIVLDREVFESTACEVTAMIGDTNIYFSDPDDLSCGEIEVMIAEEGSRGSGKGKEALVLMLTFAMDILQVYKVEAKIKFDNHQSIGLFTKLGFKEISRSDIFQEITYVYDSTDESNLNQTKELSKPLEYRTLQNI